MSTSSRFISKLAKGLTTVITGAIAVICLVAAFRIYAREQRPLYTTS